MFLDKIEKYEEESNKLKIKYNKDCSICNGEGLKKSSSGYVTCDCTKKANIQARLICNGLPKKCLNNNWNNITGFSNDINVINTIKDYCSDIDENVYNGNNLFINCLNKNKIMMLESSIANDIGFKKNQNGFFYNILFVTLEDLLQTQYVSKNNYDMRNKFQKTIMNVDVLILNYLGEETDNRNDNTARFINDLVVKRTFDEKVTIISSSLNFEDVANKYGAQFISTIKNNFKFLTVNETLDEIESVGEDSNGYY